MLTNTFAAVMLASLLACGVTTAGIYVISKHEQWGKEHSVSTPLGTLVSYPFVSHIKRSTLGILLAISAGALVYVGASHLLPTVERETRRYSLPAMAAGVLIAVVIVVSKG